ncbi:hypothetical protein Vadar_010944 [Vaccinium darrowii]|uniref:Uncharacterized protein n=1 Tax=Vaccinium darrowii TaxID=229202 RepID=A0ACB7Y7G3_9ERIC|nr:hypothetical protein Vadar_010944 [Vaccinium darrowii]
MGHMTTWCLQFKAYLEEKVAEGKLAEYIDHEKTTVKAKGQNNTDDKDEDLIDVVVIHGYADADAEQRLREELKAANQAKEVMAISQPVKKVKPDGDRLEDLRDRTSLTAYKGGDPRDQTSPFIIRVILGIRPYRLQRKACNQCDWFGRQGSNDAAFDPVLIVS